MDVHHSSTCKADTKKLQSKYQQRCAISANETFNGSFIIQSLKLESIEEMSTSFLFNNLVSALPIKTFRGRVQNIFFSMMAGQFRKHKSLIFALVLKKVTARFLLD